MRSADACLEQLQIREVHTVQAPGTQPPAVQRKNAGKCGKAAESLPFPALFRCEEAITGVASHIRRRSRRRTPYTGVYLTQPPRRNPAARVLVPGSGMTKPSKRTFKAPGGVHRHTTAPRSATGRAPRHGAGIRPPEGRHVPSAHIRARLTPVLYRSSFVVVVSNTTAKNDDSFKVSSNDRQLTNS